MLDEGVILEQGPFGLLQHPEQPPCCRQKNQDGAACGHDGSGSAGTFARSKWSGSAAQGASSTPERSIWA